VKPLDVLETAAKKVADVVLGPVAQAPRSAAAEEELRRRAEVNARGAATRAELWAGLLGGRRWIRRRPGWFGKRGIR
jgi:hypothetical protein